MHTGNYLLINGELIAIEGEVSFERYSPFIDNTAVLLPASASYVNPRGNYTQSFKVTDPRMNILTGFNLLQSAAYISTFTNVRLLCNGQLIDTGTLGIQRIKAVINKPGVAEYDCILFNAGAPWINAVNGKTLKGLFMDGGWQAINTANGQPAIQNTEASVPSGSPVCNSIADLLNYLTGNNDHSTGEYAALYGFTYNEGTIAIIDGVTTYTTQPSILFPMDTVDPPTQWSFFFDHPDMFPWDYLQPTTAFANNIVKNGNPYICFPVYAADFSAAGTDSCCGHFNHFGAYTADYGAFYSADGTINLEAAMVMPGYTAVKMGVEADDYEQTFVSYTPLRNQIVPMYYLHQVLRHCFAEFGYNLTGDFINDPDFQKLILPNTYSILKEEVLNVANLYGSGNAYNLLYIQNPTEIVPANHLPAMNIVDFVRDFMMKFNASITFEGINAVIKRNQLQLASGEISDYEQDVEIEFAANALPGINCKYTFPSGDKSYAAVAAFTGNLPATLYESLYTSAADITYITNYMANLQAEGRYIKSMYFIERGSGDIMGVYDSNTNDSADGSSATWAVNPVAGVNLNDPNALHNLVPFIAGNINTNTSNQIQSFSSALPPVETLDDPGYTMPLLTNFNNNNPGLPYGNLGWTGVFTGFDTYESGAITGPTNSYPIYHPGTIAWFSHNPSYQGLTSWLWQWQDYESWEFHGTHTVSRLQPVTNGVPVTAGTVNTGDTEQKCALYAGIQPCCEHGQTTAFPGNNFGFPFMTFNNYVEMNSGILEANMPSGYTYAPQSPIQFNPWNLCWNGKEGLLLTFWNVMLNVFIKNKKVTLNATKLSWMGVKNFDFTTSRIIRGRKYYIASIKGSLPGFMKTFKATFECYEL